MIITKEAVFFVGKPQDILREIANLRKEYFFVKDIIATRLH